MNRLVLTVAAASAAAMAYGADMNVASNVYEQTMNIYKGHGDTPMGAFYAVRGGGFYNELSETNYMPFCEYVSNHCSQIIADWPVYETNEMVRFTTLSAIGFSGFVNYTNAVDRIIAGYETNVSYCSWQTVRFLKQPYGTASYMSLDWTYDRPGISNLVLRIRAIAASQGLDSEYASATVETCDNVLSGRAKEDCIDSMTFDNWRPPVTE